MRAPPDSILEAPSFQIAAMLGRCIEFLPNSARLRYVALSRISVGLPHVAKSHLLRRH